MHENLNFKLAHVGFNCGEGAGDTARELYRAFGFQPQRESGLSIFAGPDIELMKTSLRGTHGHIGVSTTDLPGAMEYLKGQGFTFNLDSAKYDADGNLKLIYLDGEIGGFAFHLVRAR